MVCIDNGNLYHYKGNVLALIAVFGNAVINFSAILQNAFLNLYLADQLSNK